MRTKKILSRRKFHLRSNGKVLWSFFSSPLSEFMLLAIMYYWEHFFVSVAAKKSIDMKVTYWEAEWKANFSDALTHLRLLFFMCRNNNSWCANFSFRMMFEHAIIIKFDDARRGTMEPSGVISEDEMLWFPLKRQCLIIIAQVILNLMEFISDSYRNRSETVTHLHTIFWSNPSTSQFSPFHRPFFVIRKRLKHFDNSLKI